MFIKVLNYFWTHFCVHKGVKQQERKMSVLLKVVIFWTIFTSTIQHTYGLDVDPNGIYSDVIVEISDKVPRQKCQRALDNLEVRTSLSHIFYSFYIRISS